MKTLSNTLLAFIVLITSNVLYADDISQNDLVVIKELAHIVQLESKKLHSMAESDILNTNEQETIFIENLHDFSKSSKKFHKVVEINLNSPMQTRSEFYTLLIKFNGITREMENFETYRTLSVPYSIIVEKMEKINFYYNFWNFTQVKSIGHTINKQSQKIFKSIDSELNGGRTSHERGTIEALTYFAETAHEFHEGVEENFSTPENTRILLRNMLDAQFDAEFELEYINISPRLLKRFNSLTSELRKLQVIYKWRWTL